MAITLGRNVGSGQNLTVGRSALKWPGVTQQDGSVRYLRVFLDGSGPNIRFSSSRLNDRLTLFSRRIHGKLTGTGMHASFRTRQEHQVPPVVESLNSCRYAQMCMGFPGFIYTELRESHPVLSVEFLLGLSPR